MCKNTSITCIRYSRLWPRLERTEPIMFALGAARTRYGPSKLLHGMARLAYCSARRLNEPVAARCQKPCVCTCKNGAILTVICVVQPDCFESSRRIVEYAAMLASTLRSSRTPRVSCRSMPRRPRAITPVRGLQHHRKHRVRSHEVLPLSKGIESIECSLTAVSSIRYT